jgi:DNA-3-methyladenine glycosylase II
MRARVSNAGGQAATPHNARISAAPRPWKTKRKSIAILKARSISEKLLISADPALGRVIAAVSARMGQQAIKPSKASPFEALVRAVVYQSVSGKSAATIFARLKERLGGNFRPKKVARQSTSALAAAGLSGSKAGTVRELALWFCAHPALARRFKELSDDEIVDSLTRIPGIGLWTVNVFLIFSLARPDVIPASDLGVRRGVQLVCNLKQPATPKQVQERSRRWQPYRSIASIYLWNAVKLNLSQNDLKGRKKA